MAREAGYEHLHLRGLDPSEVTRLLGALAGHDVEEKVGAAWVSQTEGNPFFIQELLRHLVEEGSLFQDSEGRWTTSKPLADLGVPQRVREVVARRLARLSKDANQLLQAAAAFDGPFRFDVVEAMAGLPELEALDALDEALASRLVVPAGAAESYVFVRTLIRRTVYRELSPSRQVRLHRRAAEALEAAAGPHPTGAQAGEIAVQYHQSQSLPGADRGAQFAVTAADQAQSTGGYDEAAGMLRMALDLVPEDDPRRPRLLGRLGIVLAWALAFDEAVAIAAEAGDAIAEAESKGAAAEYLSDAAYVTALAGGITHAWDLARQGLTYAGARDVAWARLVSFDVERRAAEDPERTGVPIDSAERRESARILREARLDPLGPAPMEAVFDSREEALQSANLIVLQLWGGEYAHCLPLLEAEATEAEAVGRVARAARGWALTAVCQVALGLLQEGAASALRSEQLANRLGTPSFQLIGAKEALAVALDEGWEPLASLSAALAESTNPALAWGRGWMRGVAAKSAAACGRAEDALDHLGRLVSWIEHAPSWTLGLPKMTAQAADTLWRLERRDHVDDIEQALREKVIGPGFRHANVDGRHSLAQLCALTGRHDEAARWFTEARMVLAEQQALPLLAICDHDEALMYARRGSSGDADRATPLLESARRQFESIGMTGWLRRAEELAVQLA